MSCIACEEPEDDPGERDENILERETARKRSVLTDSCDGRALVSFIATVAPANARYRPQRNSDA